MKVLQVVPPISASSSGTSYCVPAMCMGLIAAGADVELHTLGHLPERYNFPTFAYPVSRFPVRAAGRSPEMFAGLRSACAMADIIHTNGLWMYPNVYPDAARQGTSCRFVLQPHGTMSEWSLRRSRIKKWLFGLLGQYAALRNADMFVATAEDEYEDIRRLGYKQPVVVLPNGVDLPTFDFNAGAKNSRERRRIFFLSRIHPKKNVEMLLHCWAKLEDRFADWDLSIVGPDKDNHYADEMKELSMALGCQRVTFEGELKGESKYKFMAESECEVLPTYSENFGMVVAEALACGTPVICSHGAPWEGLSIKKCGWWVSTDEVSIESAMIEAMSMSREELVAMGLRGYEWMRQDFDWNAIGRKMKIAYEWLLGVAEKPEWVRMG